MAEAFWLRRFFLFLPKERDIAVFAFTYRALLIIAETLLSPERALSLQVDLVGAEVRSLPQ